jgi:hypothetical protein
VALYNDRCACGSNKLPVDLVMHEVGHAMGFFQVSDRAAVMYPSDPVTCGPAQLSPAEKFHAAVAYSRPRGNLDPDIDPSNRSFVVSETRVRIEVVN